MKIYLKYKSWASLRRTMFISALIQQGIFFSKIQRKFCLDFKKIKKTKKYPYNYNYNNQLKRRKICGSNLNESRTDQEK